MDRKRRSNCAALRAVLIFPTFVSYFVYHWLYRVVLSRYSEPLINGMSKNRKLPWQIAILDNIRSSFSVSQNCSAAHIMKNIKTIEKSL